MTLKWFTARTVRQATSMCRHVRKLLRHQRDLLAPRAIVEVEQALHDMESQLARDADRAALLAQMESLDKTTRKWIKPYPNAAWRENIEVLLVALAIAMGVRTFFLQPFKIPTGSMQPTLYGVTHENLLDKPDSKIPTGLQRIKEWFQGVSYVRLVAKTDGRVEAITQPFPPAILRIFQRVKIGGKWHVIWFPPDYGAPPGGTLEARAGLTRDQVYRKGDEVIRLKVQSGDHLFVDRLTYNFRPPRRGEIIVFETHGITRLPPEQQATFYIKRLVGLSGETLRLEQDYILKGAPVQTFRGVELVDAPVGHLVVDGRHLGGSTPHFENVYSFNSPPRGAQVLEYEEDSYFGHAMIGELAPGSSFTVGTNRLFVLGDNTMNSLDGRSWGDLPKEQVIGKSFFVYWPLTKRFGVGSSY
ncbi:MAG TPA: signal peptidase I [Verrucomicrobiota bacterium]|nr:signal peptidase I [Verrucomicrobiota bacterium]